MANENIVIDLSENYGDVAIRSPEDRITLLSFIPILKRYWLLCAVIFISGLGASILAAFMLPGSTSYKASGKLLFQPSDTKSELTGIADNLDPLESTGILVNPLSTQATLLNSGFLAEDVVSNLNLRDPEGELRSNNYVRTNLSVEPLPSTDILRVAFNSSDPEEAAEVVNELMRLYKLFIEQEQKAEIVAAKKFVDEQLPRLKDDLNFASRSLEQFKAQNQVVALERQAGDIASLLTGLDRQLNDTQVALKAANVRKAELIQQLSINSEEALDLSTLNDTPGVQEVLQELQAVETELARQSGLYLPQHPTIINLENQANELTALLQERVNVVLSKSSDISLQDLQLGSLKQSLLSELVQTESERILLETQLSAYGELKLDYANQALRFPSLEREQFELELDLENSQQSYNELLKRSQEISLAEIQIDGTNYVQIIEKARPPQAVTSTYNPGIIALGTVVSLLLSIGTGLVLDLSNKSVKTADELAKLLDYPLLGLIPDFSKNSEVKLSSTQAISQSSLDVYRSIYSSLKVADLEAAIQVIVVTSAIHYEGKSEVAANLAKAIAQSHRRVLLIDADLKTPVQHQLWQIPNDLGLSHILAEKSSTDLATHQLDPYLSVMTAGLPVAEPSLFLESSQMKDLLCEVKAKYTYIIIDASPLLTEADALLLGRASEGIIFVGQPKHVQKTDILAASQLIEQAKLRVLGLVINRVSNHEQKVNRIPFSNTYQSADEHQSHQKENQAFIYKNMTISPHDLNTNNKVLSNLNSNSGGKS